MLYHLDANCRSSVASADYHLNLYMSLQIDQPILSRRVFVQCVQHFKSLRKKKSATGITIEMENHTWKISIPMGKHQSSFIPSIPWFPIDDDASFPTRSCPSCSVKRPWGTHGGFMATDGRNGGSGSNDVICGVCVDQKHL